MTTLQLPATVEEAATALGELVRATEWKRAAIVATFVWVAPTRGGNRRSNRIPGLKSTDEFAALRIIGLRDADTVRLYASRWLDKFPRPKPGDTITLPNIRWEPTRTGTNGHSSEEGARKVIAEIVEEHGAEIVAEAVADLPDEQVAEVTETIHRKRPEPARTGQHREVMARFEKSQKGAKLSDPNEPLPEVFPNQGAMEFRMDFQAAIASLHSKILDVDQYVRKDAGVAEEYADRIEHEAEILHMIALAARGIGQQELDDLLNGASS